MKPVASKLTGFTLIEMIVTITIVSILASVAMPMLQVTVQRSKENELRADLRQIREAIDAYKKAADDGRIKKSIDESGYPPNLDVLVEGVKDIKSPKEQYLKFLRKIPTDPMLKTNQDEVVSTSKNAGWGLRSYASSEDSPSYDDDVFDVYSLSPLTGTNGVPYAKW